MEKKEAEHQEKYLEKFSPAIRKTLTYEQKQEFIKVMDRMNVPVKSHHPVDLHFTFWFIKRWYIVFMAGLDMRDDNRDRGYNIFKKGAIVLIRMLFYSIILLIILLGLYLLKSAFGIDIFSDFHLMT